MAAARCLTRDTLAGMADVSMRDLRNHGGDVVDRVARGERVTVTRDGKPVAELRPLGPSAVSVSELVRRRLKLPRVDSEALRADIDAVVEGTLR